MKTSAGVWMVPAKGSSTTTRRSHSGKKSEGDQEAAEEGAGDHHQRAQAPGVCRPEGGEVEHEAHGEADGHGQGQAQGQEEPGLGQGRPAQAEHQLPHQEHRDAAEEQVVDGPPEVAGKPVAEEGEGAVEVGDDVPAAHGALHLPPAPEGDDHDQGLHRPVPGEDVREGVPRDVCSPLIGGDQGHRPQVAEAGVGEEAGQVLGAVGQLAPVGPPGDLGVDPHRPPARAGAPACIGAPATPARRGGTHSGPTGAAPRSRR